MSATHAPSLNLAFPVVRGSLGGCGDLEDGFLHVLGDRHDGGVMKAP